MHNLTRLSTGPYQEEEVNMEQWEHDRKAGRGSHDAFANCHRCDEAQRLSPGPRVRETRHRHGHEQTLGQTQETAQVAEQTRAMAESNLIPQETDYL